MPYAAPRICGCGAKVARGARCACQVRRAAAVEKARPSARERGYDTKWERNSKAFLALPENRLCCCGCGRASTLVDHKVPHRGDAALFWARSNWQAMAGACHSRKTARQDGGFGHAARGERGSPRPR